MTLFLIGVALFGIGCRVLQHRLDRLARSLQPSDELRAARQAAVRASREEQYREIYGDPPKGHLTWSGFLDHEAADGPR